MNSLATSKEMNEFALELQQEIDQVLNNNHQLIQGGYQPDDTRVNEIVEVLRIPLALALAERAMRLLREQPYSENALRDLDLSCRLQPGNFTRHYWLANFLRSHFEHEEFVKLREALIQADLAVQNIAFGDPSEDVIRERTISAYSLRARIKSQLGFTLEAVADQKIAFDAAIVLMSVPAK